MNKELITATEVFREILLTFPFPEALWCEHLLKELKQCQGPWFPIMKKYHIHMNLNRLAIQKSFFPSEVLVSITGLKERAAFNYAHKSITIIDLNLSDYVSLLAFY